jgi:hypothetical protein
MGQHTTSERSYEAEEITRISVDQAEDSSILPLRTWLFDHSVHSLQEERGGDHFWSEFQRLQASV